MDNDAYLDVDVAKVRELNLLYKGYLTTVEEGLPLLNYYSPAQIIDYTKENFGILLENVTISHITSHLNLLDHDSPEFDFCNGLLLWLKLRYTLTNYIECLLRHHVNGRVSLRQKRGEWVLPNKRPLPTCPEILECVVTTHLPKGDIHGSNFVW